MQAFAHMQLSQGKHCCGVKISGFPIQAITGWQEADVKKLSREQGMVVFKRGKLCGIGRKTPGKEGNGNSFQSWFHLLMLEF